MEDVTEEEMYEGLTIDFQFNGEKPLFGDLFEICGYVNPNFPPTGNFSFSKFGDLQFSQVEDYFGVGSLTDEGEDVVVWLYPLVNNKVVDHNPGPFDGIRLEYNVLRNPIHRAEHFIKICRTFEIDLNVTLSRSIEEVKIRIQERTDYWKNKNIEPGSEKAMEIDY